MSDQKTLPVMETYDETSIQVLEGLEAVRAFGTTASFA